MELELSDRAQHKAAWKLHWQEHPAKQRDENVTLPLSLVAHVTYTHTSYADVWPPAFAMLGKYARQREHDDVTFVACLDKRDERIPRWMRQEYYTDGTPYTRRAAECVRKAGRPYVLLTQEDFIMVGRVDWPWISQRGALLMHRGHAAERRASSLTLISTSPQREQWHPRSALDPTLRRWHTYMAQATLWNASMLLHIFDHFPDVVSPNRLEYEVNSYQEINDQGIANQMSAWEEPRGFMTTGPHGFGYVEAHDGDPDYKNMGLNSYHYPYMSTAVWKGKWATEVFDFGADLRQLLKDFGVDISARGEYRW